MVIGDLDLVGVAFAPDEAHAVLIIHPDAVVPVAIATQRLQPVARRHAEIVQRTCRVDLSEFSQGGVVEAGRQLGRPLAVPELFGGFVGER